MVVSAAPSLASQRDPEKSRSIFHGRKVRMYLCYKAGTEEFHMAGTARVKIFFYSLLSLVLLYDSMTEFHPSKNNIYDTSSHGNNTFDWKKRECVVTRLLRAPPPPCGFCIWIFYANAKLLRFSSVPFWRIHAFSLHLAVSVSFHSIYSIFKRIGSETLC